MTIHLNNAPKTVKILSLLAAEDNICIIKDVFSSFSDKWSIYTILLLGQSNKMRFNGIRAQIPGISQRMLAVTLRGLEKNGVVSRIIYNDLPPKIEYSLTSLGEGLLKQLIPLVTWIAENRQQFIMAKAGIQKHIDP